MKLIFIYTFLENWRILDHFKVHTRHFQELFPSLEDSKYSKRYSTRNKDLLTVKDVISSRLVIRNWMIVKFLLNEYVDVRTSGRMPKHNRSESGNRIDGRRVNGDHGGQPEEDGNAVEAPLFSSPSIFDLSSQYANASPRSIKRRISIFLREGTLALKTMSKSEEKFRVRGTSLQITSRMHPMAPTRFTFHCSDIEFKEYRILQKKKKNPWAYCAPHRNLLRLLNPDSESFISERKANLDRKNDSSTHSRTFHRSYEPSMEEILLQPQHRHYFLKFLYHFAQRQIELNTGNTHSGRSNSNSFRDGNSNSSRNANSVRDGVGSDRGIDPSGSSTNAAKRLLDSQACSHFILGSVLIWISCKMCLSSNKAYLTEFTDILDYIDVTVDNPQRLSFSNSSAIEVRSGKKTKAIRDVLAKFDHVSDEMNDTSRNSRISNSGSVSEYGLTEQYAFEMIKQCIKHLMGTLDKETVGSGIQFSATNTFIEIQPSRYKEELHTRKIIYKIILSTQTKNTSHHTPTTHNNTQYTNQHPRIDL